MVIHKKIKPHKGGLSSREISKNVKKKTEINEIAEIQTMFLNLSLTPKYDDLLSYSLVSKSSISYINSNPKIQMKFLHRAAKANNIKQLDILLTKFNKYDIDEDMSDALNEIDPIIAMDVDYGLA